MNNLERMNFPNRHPLAGTGPTGYQPDVALCLEMNDLQNETRAARARNGKIIHISSLALSHKSNRQDFGHYADVDLDIGADAEATLPMLIEACKKLITSDRRIAIEERGKKMAGRLTNRLATGPSLTRTTDGTRARSVWRASPLSCGP